MQLLSGYKQSHFWQIDQCNPFAFHQPRAEAAIKAGTLNRLASDLRAQLAQLARTDYTGHALLQAKKQVGSMLSVVWVVFNWFGLLCFGWSAILLPISGPDKSIGITRCCTLPGISRLRNSLWKSRLTIGST